MQTPRNMKRFMRVSHWESFGRTSWSAIKIQQSKSNYLKSEKKFIGSIKIHCLRRCLWMCFSHQFFFSCKSIPRYSFTHPVFLFETITFSPYAKRMLECCLIKIGCRRIQCLTDVSFQAHIESVYECCILKIVMKIPFVP